MRFVAVGETLAGCEVVRGEGGKGSAVRGRRWVPRGTDTVMRVVVLGGGGGMKEGRKEGREEWGRCVV